MQIAQFNRLLDEVWRLQAEAAFAVQNLDFQMYWQHYEAVNVKLEALKVLINEFERQHVKVIEK